MSRRVILRFEEPPPRPSRPAPGKTKHERIATKLRRRPNEWARVAVYSNGPTMSSIAHGINTGKILAYAPAGDFEAVGRTLAGKHGVWARYVGDGSV